MNQNVITGGPSTGELVPALCYCPRCGTGCEACDAYCRGCGSRRAGIAQAAGKPLAPRQAHQSPALSLPSVAVRMPQWLGNRWIVLGVLLVAGPLGLPALWLSPRFSPTTKILTSAVYFLLTVAAPLAVTWYWLDTALQPLVESFSELPQLAPRP